MRQSIGTCCVVALALLGLAGCGSDGATTASTATPASASSTGGIASSSSPATIGSSAPAGASSNTVQQTLISGTPPTVVGVGQKYTFRPGVTAAAAVTFHIAGKPSWATFDTVTGTLSGTPATADVGVNTGVQITASNNTTTAVLPTFEITVMPTAVAGATGTTGSVLASTSSVTVNWQQPTTNTDGSPLTGLASYKVYFGTASQQYTNSITIASPTELSSIVGSLEVGRTYYFAVTAITSAGVESAYSPEISATI